MKAGPQPRILIIGVHVMLAERRPFKRQRGDRMPQMRPIEARLNGALQGRQGVIFRRALSPIALGRLDGARRRARGPGGPFLR